MYKPESNIKIMNRIKCVHRKDTLIAQERTDMKKNGKISYILFSFRSAPAQVTLMMAGRVLLAACPALFTYIMAGFVDEILALGEWTKILFWLLLLLGMTGLMKIGETGGAYLEKEIRIKNEAKLRSLIFEKTEKLAFCEVEKEELLALRKRIVQDVENRVTDGFANQLLLCTYAVNIVSVVFVISAHVWWVGLATLVIIGILFWVSKVLGEENYEAFEEAEEYRRRADFLHGILTQREYVSEKTLFQYKEFVQNRWHQTFEKARVIEYRAQVKTFLRAGGVNLITSLLTLCICVILLFPLTGGRISAGTYMALVTAAFSLTEGLAWGLSGAMQDYEEYRLYGADLQKFLQWEEECREDKANGRLVSEISTVEFQNVSFRYPQSETDILHHVSFRMERGKSYVLLGTNGAGKSTIVKHYDTCIYDRGMAKETRVLGIGAFFLKKLQNCMKEAQAQREENNKKIARVSLLIDLTVLLEYAAIVLLMLFFMAKGVLSAGGFAAIFKSIDEIFDMLENLLGGRLGDFAQNYEKSMVILILCMVRRRKSPNCIMLPLKNRMRR